MQCTPESHAPLLNVFERVGKAMSKQSTQPRPSWHGLYSTKAWQSLRRDTLVRDLFTCQICNSVANVVDHIKAHKGDPDLFWDQANLQSLCKPCHDRHAQRRDRGGDARAIGPDGWPIGER